MVIPSVVIPPLLQVLQVIPLLQVLQVIPSVVIPPLLQVLQVIPLLQVLQVIPVIPPAARTLYPVCCTMPSLAPRAVLH